MRLVCLLLMVGYAKATDCSSIDRCLICNGDDSFCTYTSGLGDLLYEVQTRCKDNYDTNEVNFTYATRDYVTDNPQPHCANINHWNVGSIQTLYGMFSSDTNFNQPIGNWDVGQVTDMRRMFFVARTFNQDLSEWDVSQVTTMENMFGYTNQFNQDISSWDVSRITNMKEMFKSASLFNQNISAWDVRQVTTMESMLYGASVFNQPLDWDTSKVRSMENMFRFASGFNQPIQLETAYVQTTRYMFGFASAFNQDISGWRMLPKYNPTTDPNAPTYQWGNRDMHAMFYMSAFNQDTSSWCRWNTATDTDYDGVCNVDEIVGCYDSNACNYNIFATDTGSCTYKDNICESCSGEQDGTGVVVDNDQDNDEVCDADEIVGCQDNTACNYMAAATNAGECAYKRPTCDECSGETDGSGTVINNNQDGDEVCDADEIVGCQNVTACNYNTFATDPGTCIVRQVGCDMCSGETDGTGYVIQRNHLNDTDGDFICDVDEIVGCQDPLACNYHASATDSSVCIYKVNTCDTCSGEQDGTGVVVDNDPDNDGVCDVDEIVGCLDAIACNFNKFSTDYGDCEYADPCDLCSGGDDGTGIITDRDADNDGVCDADEVPGCGDIHACNYMSTATELNGCLYPVGCQVCSAEKTITFANQDNVYTVDGVTNPSLTECAGNITFAREGSGHPLRVDIEGFVDVTTTPHTQFMYVGEYNYWCIAHPVAMRGTLTITDCAGVIVDTDADNDGVCDDDEVVGCQDSTACNYHALATDVGNCAYRVHPCDTCSGGELGTGTVVQNDFDGDNVCDWDENAGCRDSAACNYHATATEDAQCYYAIGDCQSCSMDKTITFANQESTAYTVNGTANPTITECNGRITFEREGSGHALHVDVDGFVDVVSGTPHTQFMPIGDYSYWCVAHPDAMRGTLHIVGCVGTVIDQDDDGDGVCNDQEIVGCQDPTACNYNEHATDAGDCDIPDSCDVCSGETDGTGTRDDRDRDNDGVCNDKEILGCQDPVACNYHVSATDADVCAYKYPPCDLCTGEQDGTGTVIVRDQDQDGICDWEEIVGCQHQDACNYKDTATDNATCLFPGPCDTCSGETNGRGQIIYKDADGDGVCNDDEILGCQDPDACNYQQNATEHSTCVFKRPYCDTCSGAQDGTGYVVNGDVDDDGVCNQDEILGCQDKNACNYHAFSTEESVCFSKESPCDVCSGQQDGTGTVLQNDADLDNICDADEQCEHNVCKNGATCEDLFKNFSCTCTEGWIGNTCEDPAPCPTNQNGDACVHGQAIRNLQDALCECQCEPEFGGATCEIERSLYPLDLSFKTGSGDLYFIYEEDTWQTSAPFTICAGSYTVRRNKRGHDLDFGGHIVTHKLDHFVKLNIGDEVPYSSVDNDNMDGVIVVEECSTLLRLHTAETFSTSTGVGLGMLAAIVIVSIVLGIVSAAVRK